MERSEAADIVGELKGLMPMLTTEQAKMAFDLVLRRDNVLAIRVAIRGYVTDNTQFSIAGFKACLPHDPNESANAAAVVNYTNVRAEGEKIDAAHKVDNALVDSLTPEVLDRLEREAVAMAPAERRAVIGNRPGRRFQSVRTDMAAIARREGFAAVAAETAGAP